MFPLTANLSRSAIVPTGRVVLLLGLVERWIGAVGSRVEMISVLAVIVLVFLIPERKLLRRFPA